MSAYIAMKGVITNVDENIRNDEDVAFEYEIQKTRRTYLHGKDISSIGKRREELTNRLGGYMKDFVHNL